MGSCGVSQINHGDAVAVPLCASILHISYLNTIYIFYGATDIRSLYIILSNCTNNSAIIFLSWSLISRIICNILANNSLLCVRLYLINIW